MSSNQNLEVIVKNINFVELIKYFSINRFRQIFPLYNPPFTDVLNNDNSKKKFVLLCLDTDKKEFIGLLLHSGQYNAAHIIEPTTFDITDATQLDPRKGKITSSSPYLDLNPSKDRLIANKPFSASNEFKMSESPRGICLIINNYLTFGTFKETQRFRNIFYQLHFDVIMEKNLTANQIMQKLTELSKNPVLAKYDAFACLIISHGTQSGHIVGFDGVKLDMKKMYQLLDDNKCKNLFKKPRIFVFNCCRGGIKYETPTLSEPSDQTQLEKPELPVMSNFFIIYTNLDGFAAKVNWDTGTKFGEVLCNTFVNKGWHREINNILISSNHELQQYSRLNGHKAVHKCSVFIPSVPKS